MQYPSTWKEDRKLSRGGGFQPSRRRLAIPRPPSAQLALGRIQPLRAFSVAKRFARRVPYLGLLVLAGEVGWNYWSNHNSGKDHSWAGPAGWTYGGPCNRIGDPNFLQAQFAGIQHCILGSTGGQTLGTPIADVSTSFHLGAMNGSKMEDREWWFREAGTFPGSVPVHPGQDRIPIPPGDFDPWERYTPMDLPINPVGTPVPNAPQTLPTPSRRVGQPSPTERSKRGPKVKPLTKPQKLPKPRRRTKTRPKKRPKLYSKPARAIRLVPRRIPRELPPARPQPRLDRPPPIIDAPPRESFREPGPTLRPRRRPTRPKPSRHELKKPGRRTREIKGTFRTQAAFDIFRTAFEAGFEAIDAIEAIYFALPVNVRNFYRIDTAHDIKGMVWVIYRHTNLINQNRMVENLLLNELEDRVIAILGKASQRAARRLGLSTGPLFGSSARLRRMRELVTQEEDIIRFVSRDIQLSGTFR